MSDIAPTWYLYLVPKCHLVSPPKRKYLLTVCRLGVPRVFLVNTRQSPYTGKSPEGARSQVVITGADHYLLEYDSYVDCLRLFRYPDGLLLACRHHPVSKQAKQDIQEAVRISRTISKQQKRLILEEP